MPKQLLSKEEADALLDEYEEYKKRNEYPVGEHHHIAVPFVIWLKHKKKVTNFPWKLYKEEEDMEKIKTKDLLDDVIGEKEKPTNLDVLVALFPNMTILKTRSGILIQTKSNDWHNEPYGGR